MRDIGNDKQKYFSEEYAHKRLYRYHQTLSVHVQLFFSMASSSLAMVGVAYWLHEVNMDTYKILAIINCMTIFIVFQMIGVYHQSSGIVLGRRRRLLFGLWVLSKAWFTVIVFTAFYTFLIESFNGFKSEVFVIWSILAFIVQAAGYSLIYFVSKRYRTLFNTSIPCLIVGSNELSQNLIANLRNNIWLTESVVGVLKTSESWNNSVPVLGDVSDIREVIQRYKIKRVYITLMLRESNQVEDIVSRLDNQCVDIIWVPDILSIHTIDRGIRELSGMPLLVLSGSPMKKIAAVLIKSVMDRVLAIVLLILLSPIFIVTAVAIKLTSPGTVFFKQKRHGWDGSDIEIWKFRSMYTPKANSEFELAKRNDPRVTTVGKFIRKTSIDELPQLFNVIQGNMSLVGPRPHAVEVNQFYSQYIPDFMLRHRIKPGITGLAQICGYRGGDDCTIATLDLMEKRATYDIEYINRWSLLLDLKILLLTPFKIFSHDAY